MNVFRAGNGSKKSPGLTEIPTLRVPVTVSQMLFCEAGLYSKLEFCADIRIMTKNSKISYKKHHENEQELTEGEGGSLALAHSLPYAMFLLHIVSYYHPTT